MSNSGPLFVFAGGGTGGHLFPGIAIGHALRAACPDIEIEFLCTERAVDGRVLTTADLPHTALPVRPLSMHPLRMPRFLAAWRQSTRICCMRFAARRPVAVIGTGGFGSGPAVRTAARMDIPTALLNPDAIPGRANRFLARFADRIYVQWPESRAAFRPDQTIEALGCPVRKPFLEARGDVRQFGLSADRLTLLITGASTGAQTINDAMMALADDLGTRTSWQVLHIAGPRDVNVLQAAYDRARVTAAVVDFIDDMAPAVRRADVVLGRAGAVTLAELAAAARPAVLMPYPFHADNHQTHNANQLAAHGAAIVVQDRRDAPSNAAALRAALFPLLDCAATRDAMSAAAARCAHPTADTDIAHSLLKLCRLAPTVSV